MVGNGAAESKTVQLCQEILPVGLFQCFPCKKAFEKTEPTLTMSYRRDPMKTTLNPVGAL